MDSLITNIRVGVSHEPPPHGPWSRVVLESTVPLAPIVSYGNCLFTAQIPGVRLNMPDCVISVYDGLVATVSASTKGESSHLEILLEHDAPASVRQEEGMPCSLEIKFDSAAVYTVLRDKTLVIDPGHGGRDKGGRGPVDLVEKDVVLALAKNVSALCSKLRIPCYLTRDGDQNVSFQARLECAVAHAADVFVSIHTGVERNRDVRGIRTGYMNQAGKRLAELLLAELAKKTNLPSRGVTEESVPRYNAAPRAHGPDLAGIDVPAAVVEFVTLTNPVEEGWVRSCTFMERTALAIVNAIKSYYWGAV